MNKLHYYICSLLLIAGSTHIQAQDYANLSQQELNRAFTEAAFRCDYEKVKELIEAGADTNTPIRYQETKGDCDWDIETSAFEYAIRNNCPEIVKALVKKESDLSSALELAIFKGYDVIVNELLDGGADIHHVNDSNKTPLIDAIQYARSEGEFSLQAQAKYESRWAQRQQIIKTLIEAGSDINHADVHGKTALMYAVENHDLKAVQDLLNAPVRIEINHADEDGNTALIHAIKSIRCSYINNQEYNICVNSQEILGLLAAAPGADFFHVNNKGESFIALMTEFAEKMNL